MQDATFCNARYRTREISELLPVISRTYENKLKEEKKHKWLPGHSDICLAGHIADCSDVHFLSDEAAECSRKAVNTMNEELKHINSGSAYTE